MQTVRGFMWSSRAYYKEVVKREEFMIGLYDYDPKTGQTEGTDGEFALCWVHVGGATGSPFPVENVPQLQIYNDAWNVLPEFFDMFEALANVSGQDITPEGLRLILLSCGLKDLTEYKRR